MSAASVRSVRIRLVVADPPFLAEHGVAFGLQGRNGEVEAVPAVDTSVFETEVEVVGAIGDDPVDFRGRHVNGRRGDRFLYLSWGAVSADEPFVMVARAKIGLATIPQELLSVAADDGAVTVECRLQATDAKGQPASGTVRPPALHWSLSD